MSAIIGAEDSQLEPMAHEELVVDDVLRALLGQRPSARGL